MKKKILLTLAAIVLLFSLTFVGCSGGGISQSEYDALAAQLADCQSQLAQAQSDLSTLQSDKSATDADLAAAQALVADLQQQLADLQAQYEYTGLSTAELVTKIVANYAASHYYEKDVYDCNNMASDVWDMLKAQGIDSVIVIGSIDYLISDILQSDHAWVRVEVTPGEYLALDATNGKAYTYDDDYRYFRGWAFANPLALKQNDDLKTEYNTRVNIVNILVGEINSAMNLYNNSTTQAEADKWLALYNKLKEIKDAQEVILTNLLNQIDQLATPIP